MTEPTRVPIEMVTLNLITASAGSIVQSCKRLTEVVDYIEDMNDPPLFKDAYQDLCYMKAECETIQDTLRAIVRASKRIQQPTLFGGKAVPDDVYKVR